MKVSRKILFIAGEASGDLHGAALIRELKNSDNNLSFHGIGGDKMRSEGMLLVEHINNMAYLGFVEVIKHLPHINRIKRKLLDLVQNEGINMAVLIDYPGFNLNIAKVLKQLGVKVIYYITPQVWAWGKGRVKKIKERTDKVLVILPFEKEFFGKHGIESEYVGHPLIDRINEHNFPGRDIFCRDNGLDPDKQIIAVLPGSRKQEVLKIFPETIKAADRIRKEFDFQVAVACSDNIEEIMFAPFSGEYNFRLVKGSTYELLKYSYAGLIKSGTSTLEAAMFGLPMVIVYRTSPVTYFIGKKVVKLRNIGLVNIIAGETIVPELIQNNLNERELYNELKKYIEDKKYYNFTKTRLSRVSNRLGDSGASSRAASEIIGVLENA